ncbi:hypothetical protein C817_02569 [Dorea sp. 5-2]|nr:hypothetical protein C817_02569 [Dorea sp. 5-2]
MKYSISYGGKRCEDYKLYPITRPNIPAPSRDMELLKIPGKSGILVKDNKRYEPIEIPIEFNFFSKPDKWWEVFRNAKRWLSGGGELEFSDDPDYFYKVYCVEIVDSEREMKRIGKFKANFTCDPYTYLKAGKQEYDRTEVQYNPYSEAHPAYKINGEGVCYLTVNGKAMRANVGQNITIDTERMIAYRTDGAMQNTAVSGDYEDLYLLEGANQIVITSGFGLKVIPNWRDR